MALLGILRHELTTPSDALELQLSQWLDNKSLAKPLLHNTVLYFTTNKASYVLCLIMQALSVAAVLATTTIIDGFGRRRLLISGGMAQAIFLFIMGSISTITEPTDAEMKVMVASFMLFFFF